MSVVDLDKLASAELLAHISKLSTADPILVNKLYMLAGLGFETDTKRQAAVLIHYIKTHASDVKDELKRKTVEQVIAPTLSITRRTRSLGHLRKRSRSLRHTRHRPRSLGHTRHRPRSLGHTQSGGSLFSRLLVGILTALALTTPTKKRHSLKNTVSVHEHTTSSHPLTHSDGVVNLVARNRLENFRFKHSNWIAHGVSEPVNTAINKCAQGSVSCGTHPRYIMPQIPNIDSFVDNINKMDPKLKMSYKTTTMKLSNMRPSQSEANLGKIRGMANAMKLPVGAPGRLDPYGQPIIVSIDGTVVDGHHRYFALLELGNPDIEVPVIILNYTIDLILEYAAMTGALQAPRKRPWSGL